MIITIIILVITHGHPLKRPKSVVSGWVVTHTHTHIILHVVTLYHITFYYIIA